jgi:hypothetical protein
VIRKGILLTNMISIQIVTFRCLSFIAGGTPVIPPSTRVPFRVTVLPFNAPRLVPKMSSAASMSARCTGLVLVGDVHEMSDVRVHHDVLNLASTGGCLDFSSGVFVFHFTHSVYE